MRCVSCDHKPAYIGDDEIEVVVAEPRRRCIEGRRFIELGEPKAQEDLGGLIRPAERVTDN